MPSAIERVYPCIDGHIVRISPLDDRLKTLIDSIIAYGTHAIRYVLAQPKPPKSVFTLISSLGVPARPHFTKSDHISGRQSGKSQIQPFPDWKPNDRLAESLRFPATGLPEIQSLRLRDLAKTLERLPGIENGQIDRVVTIAEDIALRIDALVYRQDEPWDYRDAVSQMLREPGKYRLSPDKVSALVAKTGLSDQTIQDVVHARSGDFTLDQLEEAVAGTPYQTAIRHFSDISRPQLVDCKAEDLANVLNDKNIRESVGGLSRTGKHIRLAGCSLGDLRQFLPQVDLQAAVVPSGSGFKPEQMPTLDDPDYRVLLRQIIDERFGGLQIRFCEATGIDESTLSHVLSGRKNLTIEKLQKALAKIGYELRFTPQENA